MTRKILTILAATTCLTGPAAAQDDDTLKIGVLLADRHVVIEKGCVVWTGSNAELAASAEVKDRYLHV